MYVPQSAKRVRQSMMSRLDQNSRSAYPKNNDVVRTSGLVLEKPVFQQQLSERTQFSSSIRPIYQDNVHQQVSNEVIKRQPSVQLQQQQLAKSIQTKSYTDSNSAELQEQLLHLQSQYNDVLYNSGMKSEAKIDWLQHQINQLKASVQKYALENKLKTEDNVNLISQNKMLQAQCTKLENQVRYLTIDQASVNGNRQIIENLQADNVQLKAQIQNMDEQIHHLTAYKQQCEQLQIKLDGYKQATLVDKQTIQKLNDQLRDFQEKCQASQKELLSCKEQLESIQSVNTDQLDQIKQLKLRSSDQDRINQGLQQQVANATYDQDGLKSQYQQLLASVQQMQQTVVTDNANWMQQTSQLRERISKFQTKLASVQKDKREVEKELLATYDQLNGQTEQIKVLSQELEQAKSTIQAQAVKDQQILSLQQCVTQLSKQLSEYRQSEQQIKNQLETAQNEFERNYQQIQGDSQNAERQLTQMKKVQQTQQNLYDAALQENSDLRDQIGTLVKQINRMRGH